MTPEEKAKDLMAKCYNSIEASYSDWMVVHSKKGQKKYKIAKRQAIVCIYEILSLKMIANMGCAPLEPSNEQDYWQKVKEEINKL